MDFFGSCSTLEPSWTQQQPQPDPVSDYFPPPTDTQTRFEMPAANLRTPRQRIQMEYVHTCKQKHCWGNAKRKSKGIERYTHAQHTTHTDTQCELTGPEGEIEWSSNIEEYWLIMVEQSHSKWASALPWECLTSSHVGGHKLYHWSSSWWYEAFVCKGNSCKIWKKSV